MERESFEDEEVADVLKQSFIAIKVDKEEHPEVDTIYMNVCQVMNGHGGWPLTILMTPEQKPFFAGTYLPKHTKGQMYGLMELLTKVAEVWKVEPQRLITSAENIVDIIKREEQETIEEVKLDRTLFGKAFVHFQNQFDQRYGGFGNAPKFPSPHNLMFLLRYAVQLHSDSALAMVEKTLKGMYQGGMYDHIGGGFCRYSTDEKWLVPHFEKMLYDNAMLVIVYCEAYQVTKNSLYEKVVGETLQYIMSEMTDEVGGFYCAQDADSEGEEGKYYVFTPEEVIRVLGEEQGTAFNQYYQITRKGNFEGANIPNRIGQKEDEDLPNVCQMKEKLYDYRKGRMKLHKDDKILTSWNGLMIVAFAKAYQVFREDYYLKSAVNAYVFIQEKMRDEKHRLAVRYRDGHRFGLGNLDDYANLIWAEITLYEVTFDPTYLSHAVQDTKEMIELFWDEQNGGFYYYGSDAPQLITRPKELYDGAIPSGNSVAAYVLQRLESLVRDELFWKTAQKQWAYLSREITDYPMAYSFALCACMLKLIESREIVCVCKDSTDLMELYQLMQKYYMPLDTVIAIWDEIAQGLAQVAPFTADYGQATEEAEIYVCEGFSCSPPMKGMESLKQYLEQH